MPLFLLLVFLSFISSCASTQTSPGIDIKALESREAKGLKKQVAQSPDGYFEMTALSKDKFKIELSEDERFYKAYFSIGGEQDVNCYIHKSRIDIGSTFHSLISGTTSKAKKIELAYLDSYLLHNWPASALSVNYLVQKDSKGFVGQIKVIAFSLPTNSVYCMHDEIGFRETFKKAVKKIAESIKFQMLDPPPKYREVHIYSLGENKVGYFENMLYDNQDDNETLISYSSVFLPKTNDTIFVSDENGTELSRKSDSVLLMSVFQSSEDGQPILSTRLDLENPESGEYVVKAQKNKGVVETGTITYKELLGGVGQSRMIKKVLLQKGQFVVSLKSYIPDLSPLALSDVSFEKLAGKKISVKFPKANIKAEVDNEGWPERLEIPLKNGVLNLGRVYKEGKPY